MPRRRTPPGPFRWFASSPEVIRYADLPYVRHPLSASVEDLLHRRGTEFRDETVRLWRVRFGPTIPNGARWLTLVSRPTTSPSAPST